MITTRKWTQDGTKINMTVPIEIKPAAFALALLLDQRDQELMDFLESRFIPLPPDRTGITINKPLKE